MELITINYSLMKNISNLGEVTVGYKYKSSIKGRPQIKTSNDAYKTVLLVYDDTKIGLQEQFIILYLNNSNTLIGCCNAFTGALTSTVVDVRIILASALKLMATGIIISHNHPSGMLKASESDIQLTKKLSKALEAIDIKLLDHIIVSPFSGFLSFKDEGII